MVQMSFHSSPQSLVAKSLMFLAAFGSGCAGEPSADEAVRLQYEIANEIPPPDPDPYPTDPPAPRPRVGTVETFHTPAGVRTEGVYGCVFRAPISAVVAGVWFEGAIERRYQWTYYHDDIDPPGPDEPVPEYPNRQFTTRDAAILRLGLLYGPETEINLLHTTQLMQNSDQPITFQWNEDDVSWEHKGWRVFLEWKVAPSTMTAKRKYDFDRDPRQYYEVFEKTLAGETTRQADHLPEPNAESDWEQAVLDVLHEINRNEATQFFMDLMAGLDPKDCERNKVFFQRLPPAPTEPDPPDSP